MMYQMRENKLVFPLFKETSSYAGVKSYVAQAL